MLQSYKKLEEKLLKVIEDKSPAFVNEVFLVFTAFGSIHFSAIIGVLIWQLGEFNLAFLIIQASAASWIVVNVFKYFIGRPRPGNSLTSLTRTSSFPSGHSTNAFSMSIVLSQQIASLNFLPLFIAAGVAVSRIVLRNHYPSDVIAGSLLGILIGHLFLLI